MYSQPAGKVCRLSLPDAGASLTRVDPAVPPSLTPGSALLGENFI